LSQSPLLNIKNLTVRDERKLLLSSFDLSLIQNQSVVLMGPGGSGKSLVRKFILGEYHSDLNYSVSTYDNNFLNPFVINANDLIPTDTNVPTDGHDLYLFDEPDKAYSLEDFLLTFNRLRSKQKSILICTHHLGFIRECSDIIYFLKYGETRGVFTPHDFFNSTDPEIAYIARMGC